MAFSLPVPLLSYHQIYQTRLYLSELPPALSWSFSFTTFASPSNKPVYQRKRLAHPLSCLFPNVLLPLMSLAQFPCLAVPPSRHFLITSPNSTPSLSSFIKSPSSRIFVRIWIPLDFHDLCKYFGLLLVVLVFIGSTSSQDQCYGRCELDHSTPTEVDCKVGGERLKRIFP